MTLGPTLVEPFLLGSEIAFIVGGLATGFYLFADAISKGSAITLGAGLRRAVSGLSLLALSGILAATLLHSLYVANG